MALKVGVIGYGGVGSGLGGQLLKRPGFAVKYGVRDINSPKLEALKASQPEATIDTVHAAVAWADAVILAVPGSHDDAGIQATAASLGPVKGKVILDALNPVSAYPGLEYRWTAGKSGGEVLAEALPDAHVFKAFNTLGSHLFSVPDGSTITGQQLTLLIAGPAEARPTAEQVVAGVGFIPQWVGPIRYARNLEALAELYIHLALPGVGTADKWGRAFHFQVLRKP